MEKCIFCNQPFCRKTGRVPSKEHFWGRSIAERLKSYDKRRGHPENSASDGDSISITQGFGARGGPFIRATIGRAVCACCNSGWLSIIQRDFVKFFDQKKIKTDLPLAIETQNREALRKWATSRLMLHSYAYPMSKCTPKNTLSQYPEIAASTYEINERFNFFRTLASPKDWRFGLAIAHSFSPTLEASFDTVGVNYFSPLAYYSGSGWQRSFLYLLHVGHIAIVITNASHRNLVRMENPFLNWDSGKQYEREWHRNFERDCFSYFFKTNNIPHPELLPVRLNFS